MHSRQAVQIYPVSTRDELLKEVSYETYLVEETTAEIGSRCFILKEVLRNTRKNLFYDGIIKILSKERSAVPKMCG